MIENAVGLVACRGVWLKLHRVWKVGLGCNGCGRTFVWLPFRFWQSWRSPLGLQRLDELQEMIGQVQLWIWRTIDTGRN